MQVCRQRLEKKQQQTINIASLQRHVTQKRWRERVRERERDAKGISHLTFFSPAGSLLQRQMIFGQKLASVSLFLSCTLNLFFSIFSLALAARVISYPFSSILALLFRLILYLLPLPYSLAFASPFTISHSNFYLFLLLSLGKKYCQTKFIFYLIL